jgi:hypothetical protein
MKDAYENDEDEEDAVAEELESEYEGNTIADLT